MASSLPPSCAVGTRILMAEDDPMVAKAYQLVLEGAGFLVEQVPNGVDAFETVEIDPARFSVVISDYKMPLLTGSDLIVRLRRRGFQGPILLISGFIDHIENIDELRALGVRILAKPLRALELLKAIEESLPPGSTPS
jgi:DNA-binding response OmpR family regulator